MFARTCLVVLAALAMATGVFAAPIARPNILGAQALVSRQNVETGAVARAMVGGLGAIDSPVIEARAPVTPPASADDESDVSQDDIDELVDTLEQLMQISTTTKATNPSKRDVQVGDSIANALRRLTSSNAMQMTQSDRRAVEKSIATALTVYRM